MSFESLTKSAFQERTGIPTKLLCPAWQDAEQVVALREIQEVVAIGEMPKPYLRALIDSIPLTGDPNVFPYRDCKIDVARVDCQHIRLSQTFVQADKCMNLLGELWKTWWGFAGTRGFAKQTCKIVLGTAFDGKTVVAHYLPPIIEDHPSGQIYVDGTHRSFIARGAGTSVESIIVRNVPVQFPTDPVPWRDVQKVAAKPPREERFINLRPELFRDLKAIGIDG